MKYITNQTKENIAFDLAEKVIAIIKNNTAQVTHIALSGGSTPFIMFDLWAKKFNHGVNWKLVHFWWVDERCVAPTDNESNYGNTKKTLFDLIDIPTENIHRVMGENNPEEEAKRYSLEIESNLNLENKLPIFDIILLGMGDDGHTASIFPHQLELLERKQTAVLAQNPYSGQNRISLSGSVINSAKKIFFLVTGKNKATIVDEIFNTKANFKKYPAAHIHTNAIWYLDKDAALKILR